MYRIYRYILFLWIQLRRSNERPSYHINLSYFYIREDGTYYWLHCRKGKDDTEVDADNIQIDMFGKPNLSKDFIMKAILSV